MHPLHTLLNNQPVQWKTLGEVADYVRGVTYSKDDETDSEQGFKILRANNITLSNNRLNFDEVKTINFSSKVKDSQKLYKNDILISAASGSREHVGKVAFIRENLDYYFGGFMGVIRSKSEVHAGYLFHMLTGHLFQDYLNEMLNSSTINNINAKVMNAFRFPIPPLPLQARIVEILDKFTACIDALNKEHTLRKKQYAHYRDLLLSEAELSKVGFEWKALGEVGELIRGNGLTKKDFTAQGVPAVHYGQIYTHYGLEASETISFVAPELAQKLKKAQHGDVLIAGTSENVQDVMKPVAWFGGEIVFSGDMYAFRPANTILPKFLTYLLQTADFGRFKEKYAHGAKVTRLSSANFLNYPVPLPPLSHQRKIVDILDRFDTLTNSITQGIPREIELRCKQYEYYRELLLTFE